MTKMTVKFQSGGGINVEFGPFDTGGVPRVGDFFEYNDGVIRLLGTVITVMWTVVNGQSRVTITVRDD